MKKILFVFIAFALTFSSCESMPPWINDPPRDEGYLFGVGTAKDKDDSIALDLAENRARVSLLRQISFNVKVDPEGELIDVTESTTSLEGSETISRWKSKAGDWWVLVSYEKPSFRDVVTNATAREAAIKTDAALKAIDEAFGKKE
jgi:hypothetical protein